jgi:TPR repeat protein
MPKPPRYSASKRSKRLKASSEHSLIYPFLDKKGRIKDYKQAFPTLLRVAQDGDAFAQNLVGYCFYSGFSVRRNRPTANYWFRLAAKGGSVEAMGNLALSCENGIGLPRDTQRAFTLYKRGAALGDAWCQCNLGCFYADMKRDLTRALHWWRQAAKQEDSKAQFNLGMAYRNGEGTRRNDRWARFWLRRAATNGHARAKRVLRQTGPIRG